MRSDVWEETEKLSDEDRVNLSKPFEEVEIKRVIDGMRKNRVVGSDGFPVEFYQTCWDILKDDIMMCFYEFHVGRLELSRINFGIILIPKWADADTIQKYRPICLLPVL